MRKGDTLKMEITQKWRRLGIESNTYVDATIVKLTKRNVTVEYMYRGNKEQDTFPIATLGVPQYRGELKIPQELYNDK